LFAPKALTGVTTVSDGLSFPSATRNARYVKRPVDMNMTRRVLGYFGVVDSLVDDFVDEVRYGGEGAQWRPAMVVWAKGQRETVLVTAVMVALYRIGRYIPIPGVNGAFMMELRRIGGPETIGLFDLVTGGNLQLSTIFALGVLPYIYASMWVQLSLAAWRVLTRRAPAPPGRDVAQATGLAAVALSILQSRVLASALEGLSRTPIGLQVAVHPGPSLRLLVVVTVTTGMAVFMWLSDYITKHGTANGMLLAFVAGILAGLPDVIDGIRAQGVPLFLKLALAVAGVTWIAKGYRAALLVNHTA
jgi:preprotein translocase subunit SecY